MKWCTGAGCGGMMCPNPANCPGDRCARDNNIYLGGTGGFIDGQRDHAHQDQRCGGWERRDPNLITSQSKWHIFKCDCGDNVWHMNGPLRANDGLVVGINVDYSYGAAALERFNQGIQDSMYSKRQWTTRQT
jgi:hypothetical protein